MRKLHTIKIEILNKPSFRLTAAGSNFLNCIPRLNSQEININAETQSAIKTIFRYSSVFPG
jgi:hypothetical protein